MKTFLKILVVLAIIVAGGVGLIFYATSGLVETTAAFFEAAKSRNYPVAYDQFSKGFKVSTSQAQMISFLSANAFDQVAATSWNSRSISLGQGFLKGTITTVSGLSIPGVRIDLVKENANWKIQAISRPSVGVVSEEGNPKVPAVTEAAALVQNTLKAFGQSVKSRDFTEFFNHIAPVWQGQTSIADLNKVFRTFVDQQIDVLPLQNQDPVFDTEPSIANGVLVIQGHYPPKVLNVSFTLKYVRVEGAWKPVGTKIEAQSVAGSKDSESSRNGSGIEAEEERQ